MEVKLDMILIWLFLEHHLLIITTILAYCYETEECTRWPKIGCKFNKKKNLRPPKAILIASIAELSHEKSKVQKEQQQVNLREREKKRGMRDENVHASSNNKQLKFFLSLSLCSLHRGGMEECKKK